jgi:hypothetical protein
MPNVIPVGTNYPRRINMYVPSMQYAMDVNINGACRVNFGAPLASVANNVANAVSIAAALTVDLTGVTPFPEPFGRTLVIVASGAGTSTVLVNGWDYLHQPIAERVTLAGATPVQMKKAFKDFNNIVIDNFTAATTVNIGSGTGLGLPYKAIRVSWEVANGVVAAAGTLTAGVLTDPQTATTGDPRGTYVPTTALNGTTIISAAFDFVNDVNTANNGGLHGIRQFAA